MADADLDAVDQRIESLLNQLGSLPDRRALAWAEELVRTLTDLYGEGLRRVLAVAPPSVVADAAGDELVSALLALHGLHPQDLRARVDAALSALPSMLGIDDARVISVDSGSVRIRLLLAAGVDRNRSTLIELVRRTVEEAAPDSTSVEVDCPDSGAPVQLGPTRAAAVPAGD